MDKYNRGYYVTKDMIEIHITEISSSNPSYKIPFGIREWPAHGDISLGQASELANFIDQNSNGIYEPELGDYPAIYGDQCLLNIFHEHPNTPNSASIETHQYYFTFNCDIEDAVENAVFVRSHKFTRDQTIHNSYSGTHVDFDLGNSSDDYAGTNVELGMVYAYNGDVFDESNAGIHGFQDTIPAVGLLTLQGSKLDNDGIDNPNAVDPTSNGSINGIGFGDNITDNEYFTMESSYSSSASTPSPSTMSHWYNVMQGLNPDSSPKTVNGVDTRHDYFGNSDASFYTSDGIDHGNNHSETNAMNPAGDRRISCASGPSTILSTDTVVLIDAYIVGSDTTSLSPNSSLNRLFEHGQTLRNFYSQNSDACGNTFDIYISDTDLTLNKDEIDEASPIILYPNPAKSSFKAQGIKGNAHVQIIDINGRIVTEETNILNGKEISIQHLENSIYFVSIEDEMGKQVIRLVKK